MAIVSHANKELKNNEVLKRKKFTCKKCSYKFSVNPEKYYISCPWCSTDNEV